MKADRHWLAGWLVALALAAPLVPFEGLANEGTPVEVSSVEVTSVGAAPVEAAVFEAAVDAAPPDPKAILSRAFANQYEVNISSTIELRMKNRAGQERTRRFEALQKIIDDRLHAIGRLTHPEYLRGMTILQIEEHERGHEAFVYMPSLQKVRRISMLQRSDSIFGTDVTYEDLERRHVEDYTIDGFEIDEFRGEPVFVIDTHPTRALRGERVIFSVAQLDDIMLEIRHYKNGAPEPLRVVSLTRAGMIEAEGHRLATHLTVQHPSRGTTTEVTFEDLRINPSIDDRVFSLRTLEQERNLSRSFR